VNKYILTYLALSISILIAKSFNLQVEANSLRNSKGVVTFYLYNKDNTIPDKNFQKFYKKQSSYIKNQKAVATFENLQEGNYAIVAFHDENNNGKVDKKFMKPKEGIGFSNFSSISIFNKPNFKKASFFLNKDSKKSIKVIYF